MDVECLIQVPAVASQANYATVLGLGFLDDRHEDKKDHACYMLGCSSLKQ